ncbi:MAG: ribose-phosphate diphosphokinase [Bdellovibrionales bacterium]|nr:ribose-phosphate diphosphokinase [Bdellovibrionales bacterium]
MSTKTDQPTGLIFSTAPYQYLAKEMLAISRGFELGEIETRSFPDGERYMRVVSAVRGQDVILIGGTINDGATLDLFDLACALAGTGCRSLKVIVPFFGYSTMERAVKPGEVVKAKTRARILSAIPIAPFGNEVLMLDLHSEGIPFYFEGPVKTRHVYAKPLVIEEARRLAGGREFVLGAPDAGRAKWVESLANDLGVPAAFVYKRRAASGEVSLSGVNLPIKGVDVIIYDDMIRTGGSILQAAKAYKDAGANRISLISTHGLFTNGALEKIRHSGLIEAVSVTNSHPEALIAKTLDKTGFLNIVSTAKLFVENLKGAYDAHA